LTEPRAALPPDSGGNAPTTVADRFILDESDEESAPRSAQWLRDWWWSGTRTERWSAALGAPVVLLLIIGTWTVLANDDSEQQAQPETTSTATASPTGTESATPAPAPSQEALVTSIVAGDTIVVLRDNQPETVRLIGTTHPKSLGAQRDCSAGLSSRSSSRATRSCNRRCAWFRMRLRGTSTPPA